jgi:SAM-dependent methyltransferase
MKYYAKFKRKMKEVGFSNIIIGTVKHYYYTALMKKYGFERWHYSPMEWRDHAQDIIKYLTKNTPETGTIVEVGCGLGEIIRNVSRDNNRIKLIGYDNKNEVLDAAKFLDKRKRVDYRLGSFNDVKGMVIDYVVAIDFMHVINPTQLKDLFSEITTDNDVLHIIVDSVLSKDFTYNHNFDEILPQNYKLIYKSKPYLAERYILVYKKD